MVRNRDLLDILRDNSISDLKKESVVVEAIIPIVAASCNNRSLDLKVIFSDTFLDAYVHGYLNFVMQSSATISKYLLVAILQLNIVLFRHLYKQLGDYGKEMKAFANHLYSSVDDRVVSYSLLFLCQYCRCCDARDQAYRLLLNTIHLCDNHCQDVIMKASELLKERT